MDVVAHFPENNAYINSELDGKHTNMILAWLLQAL